MRGTAAAPNSPLDIMLGLVDPSDPIHSEIASKSNPRQTESLGPLLAWSLMGGRLSFGALAAQPDLEGGGEPSGPLGVDPAGQDRGQAVRCVPAMTDRGPEELRPGIRRLRDGHRRSKGADYGVVPEGRSSTVRQPIAKGACDGTQLTSGTTPSPDRGRCGHARRPAG